MAMTVDRRAVGRGMAAYVGIAAPCGLIIALWHGSDQPGQESALWTLAALVVIVVAPFVAGAVAGAAQPSPLVHGALAVALPAGVFLVIRSALEVVRGTVDASKVATFVLFLAVFTSLGMVGGYVGFRRRQHMA